MPKPVILIVEDDKNDQFFISHAFAAAGVDAELQFADTAEDAITQLGEGAPPATILTDLNMPGIGGFGLLEYLKSNPLTRHIPAVVFSSSSMSGDISKAYEKLANSYVVKPFNLKGYEKFAENFLQYWTETNRLPV